MKETVLDVLMYLFESFVDSEDEPEPNRNELREDLERAGFGDREIERALDWLDGLNTTVVTSTCAAVRGDPGFRQRRGREARRARTRLFAASRADWHLAARAARARNRSTAGARQRGNRRRADQMGRDDGPLQSAGAAGGLCADGGSRVRRRLGLGPLTPGLPACRRAGTFNAAQRIGYPAAPF